MDKRLYILIFSVLFLGIVGCQKIDIKPHTDCDEQRVEQNEKANRNSEDDDFVRDEDDGEVITDPNHDEDEDEQIKR